jgi:hypothetical protein
MINEGPPKKIIRRETQTYIPGKVLLRTQDTEEFVGLLKELGFDGELELEYLQVYYHKAYRFTNPLRTDYLEFDYFDGWYYVKQLEKRIIEYEF